MTTLRLYQVAQCKYAFKYVKTRTMNFMVRDLIDANIDIRQPICDFVLMVYSKRDCITYRLCDIHTLYFWTIP